MTAGTGYALEARVTRYDSRLAHSYRALVLTPAMLPMVVSHLPHVVSLLVMFAAVGLLIALAIHRPHHLRWQPLRFTRDGIAFGDTGVGVTRAETSGWSPEPAGARMWSDRMLVSLRARPGDEERLATALQNAFGAPTRFTPRGSKLSRALALALALVGLITIVFTSQAQSLVPTSVGIAACVGGLATFVFLSTSPTVR